MSILTLASLFTRATNGGKEIHIPREEATVHGGAVVLETFKGPLRDGSGVIVGSYGYARDITQAARAEHALRESEQRLALIFNATSDMVVLMDVTTDGRLVVSAQNDAHVQHMSRYCGVGRSDANLVGRERYAVAKGSAPQEVIARREAVYQQAIEWCAPYSRASAWSASASLSICGGWG